MKIMSLRPPFFGSSKKKTCSVSRSVDSSFGSNASSEDSESTLKSILPHYPPSPLGHGGEIVVNRRRRVVALIIDGLFSGCEEYNGEGRITRRELEVVLRHLGPDLPTEEEVVFL